MNALYDRTEFTPSAAPATRRVQTGETLPGDANVRFLGCFNDRATDRALPTSLFLEGSFHACKGRAEDAGYRYFALQNGRADADGVAECWASDDLQAAQKHHSAPDCGLAVDDAGAWLGAPNVNALYERLNIVVPGDPAVRSRAATPMM